VIALRTNLYYKKAQEIAYSWRVGKCDECSARVKS